MAHAVNNSLYLDDLDEFVYHDSLPTLQIFSFVCDIIFFCVSFLGNAFILYVLLKEQAWKTAADLLVLQLAVSNICFALILPLSICNIMEVWIFGAWGCKFASGMYFLGLNSCVLFLCGMALDRYTVIVHSAHVSTQAARKHRVVVGSAVSWVVCAILSIKEAAIITTINNGPGSVHCVHMHSWAMLISGILLEVILFFFIPLILIVYCYVHMLIKQWRLSRYLQTSKLTLGVIFGIFLCLTPYNILLFVDCLEMMEVVEFNAHPSWLVVYVLLSSHCCLHPLFSIFGVRRFRKYLPLPFTPFQRSESVQNLTSLVILAPHDSSVTQPDV